MKKIVILCAGDFGKEVAWLIEDINKKKTTYDLLGFLDDDTTKIGCSYNGYECLGPISDLMDMNKDGDLHAVIATQDSGLRRKIVDMLPNYSNWETLLHPSVNISDTSKLGTGCIVCANCNISVNTVIGNQVIMNLGTTIGHDCEVGDYVSLMSGTIISGHVRIGNETYFGSNSTVLPAKKIGMRAKIGAGSVVIRNVKNDVCVMGVPAKVLKI